MNRKDVIESGRSTQLLTPSRTKKVPKASISIITFFPGPKSLAYLGRKQVRPWARARSSDPPFANLERVRGVGFIADLP